MGIVGLSTPQGYATHVAGWAKFYNLLTILCADRNQSFTPRLLC